MIRVWLKENWKENFEEYSDGLQETIRQIVDDTMDNIREIVKDSLEKYGLEFTESVCDKIVNIVNTYQLDVNSVIDSIVGLGEKGDAQSMAET